MPIIIMLNLVHLRDMLRNVLFFKQQAVDRASSRALHSEEDKSQGGDLTP